MPTTQQYLSVTRLNPDASLLRALNDFKEYSGLEINTTKTEEIWLREWKDKTG